MIFTKSYPCRRYGAVRSVGGSGQSRVQITPRKKWYIFAAVATPHFLLMCGENGLWEKMYYEKKEEWTDKIIHKRRVTSVQEQMLLLYFRKKKTAIQRRDLKRKRLGMMRMWFWARRRKKETRVVKMLVLFL